jgi:hypothetical protein
MSMDILAGMLSGVGQSYHEQQTNLLQQEMAKNKWYADQLMESSRDQRYLPQAQQRYMQGAAEALTADPMKRGAGAKAFAKAHEDSATIHVQPGDVGAPAAPASPEQTPPMAQPEKMPQMSALGNPAYNTPVPAPAPPPGGLTHSGMWSPSEMAEMAASAEGLKAGARAAGELPSKLEETRARYDAEFRTKMNQLISSLMEHGFKADVDPLTGRLSGTPMTRAELPVEKQAGIAKTEAQTGAANATAGLKRAQALSEPDKLALVQATIKYRQAQTRALDDPNSPMNQYRAAMAQHARQQVQDSLNSGDIGELADIVHDNPDAMQEFGSKERAKIAMALRAKGYQVPAKLPGPQQTQEFAAKMALDSAQTIREIMRQYPDIVGPVMGRAGLTEQEWGAPIFSRATDPAKAEAEQRLRTQMTYLLAQESKAIMGGRVPQQWLGEMKKTSPNPAQAMAFLEGSLKGVEGNANNVIAHANEARYGPVQAPKAPPGGPVTVQLPNGRKGQIDSAQVQKFLKENPGAKVVQ